MIVNPAAGAGRARRAARELTATLRALGLQVECVETSAPADGERLARGAVTEGYGPVVGVGGDGTLQEIANGLLTLPCRPPLGVVPTGRGNDFARSLGLPRAPADVATLIGRQTTRTVDLARCETRHYLAAAGVGFDAEVATAVRRSGARGALSYVLHTLLELRRHANRELTIHLDGRPLQRRAFLVAVANTRFYGGGMMICPEADPSDGLLDVCIIGNVSRAEVVRLLPGVYFGRHARHPAVEFHRVRRVRVEGPPATRVHVDGEAAGEAPVSFEIVPRALEVIAAPGDR